jgi:opacity protein-like surface antigen
LGANAEEQMIVRPVLALLALGWSAASALAADAGPPSLPTLALDPQPAPSIWSGLSVGTDVFVLARKGGKGLIGGGTDIGYTREFSNKLVLGVEATAGFTPISYGNTRFKGFDFGETDVKVGYDMGRFMPYVTTGVVLAKPNGGPGAGFYSASDSVTNLFNAKDLRAAATVGAGFEYAITKNLTFGLGVSVGTVR